MSRALSYLVIVLCCGISLPFLRHDDVPFGLVSGLMLGVLVPLIDVVLQNVRYIRLAVDSIRYRNKTVRVSLAYLFRIKVGGEYLLVRSARRPQFQPVGGVYKVSPGASAFLGEISARDDHLIPMDDVSVHDLRLRVPGRHLLRLLRWFESYAGRETSPWREFYEELIRPGILPREVFPYVMHEFLRREFESIHFSESAQCLEMRVFDIYDLLPTEEQTTVLVATKADTHPSIAWVGEDRISRLGAVPGQPQEYAIGSHTSYTL
jgi:hypothetical protein